MNLSCGNCKAIQSFSGKPLRCDVCGWVCSTSTQNIENQKASSGTKTANQSWDAAGCASTLFGLGILAAIGGFIWWLLPDKWTDKVKYSTEYSIDMDHVEWREPPMDCDFMTAPLGIKRCHYRKAFGAYNKGELLIEGDDAPTYSRDKNTDKPIVSYDKGNTWNWLPEEASTVDRTIKRVVVYWVKESN